MATVTRARFPEDNRSAVHHAGGGRNKVVKKRIPLVGLVMANLHMGVSSLDIRVLALEPRDQKASSINEKMWKALHML
jgi:hypothetical protein